ncbi:MAG: hypothetical protein JSS81_10715 [Acidobacteria bacterium]|nr:hypothetical protein [Acidobacteriota bacterium]
MDNSLKSKRFIANFGFRISARAAFFGLIRAVVISLFLAVAAIAQAPSPKTVLGFEPAADRTIADWSQITNYFARLDAKSDRVKVREIGRSTLGRPLIVAFISSPENIKNLDKLRRINARLADPASIKTPSELESLVKQGKTIVAVNCSIHSTEIVASQMSMNLAYGLASADDPDTKEILDNTILMLFPSSNPDGIDIVADWYRKTLDSKSEGSAPPELYHHYAGHDDNRDWFMLNLRETQTITRLFWQEWFPEIVYDIHQQGRNASRLILPPFYDPVNPRVDPSLLREVGLLGSKMAADLQAANVAGVATNSTYDTWWHGGFRSAPYYHNSIGILSEAASADLMSPVTVTEDELRKNRPVRGLTNLLESATNYPDPWRGGRWRPADIDNMERIAVRGLLGMAAKFRARYLRNFYELGRANLTPAAGEPQAFVVTAGQPNAETVARLLEILLTQGVAVYRMNDEGYFATDPSMPEHFHEIPLGSFLIYVNQPQKNNILSLFEKQVYPHRLLPNGEAEAPYDVAGWTLPLQMGVETETVWNIRDPEKFKKSLEKIDRIDAARKFLDLEPAKEPFAKLPDPLKTNPRIGLYKGFTGSMDEGWTRFVFDTFQIPYTSLSDRDFRENNLNADVVVLPADREAAIVRGLNPERYPEEYAGGITDRGVENLKKFVAGGGRLICFDDSCEMVVKNFELPLKNVLSGLKRSEFYNPGSIVRLDVDTTKPLAKGLRADTAAYFTDSSAFEVTDETKVTTIARYAAKDALLSGWMLGEKYLNGKAALVETAYGRGKIVLFAFRPQHRGQSWATFPLIFNALEK